MLMYIRDTCQFGACADGFCHFVCLFAVQQLLHGRDPGPGSAYGETHHGKSAARYAPVCAVSTRYAPDLVERRAAADGVLKGAQALEEAVHASQ